jgi:hypothetical protein
MTTTGPHQTTRRYLRTPSMARDRRWLALACIALAQLMVALDGNAKQLTSQFEGRTRRGPEVDDLGGLLTWGTVLPASAPGITSA